MSKSKRKIETEEELVEDTVSDNVDLSPMEGMSKTNAMSIVMKQMANMQGDKWVDFFNAVQASIGHETDDLDPDLVNKNVASVAMKGAIKEDIAAVFGDAKDLSEEFKEKTLTLFESAVNTRVSLIESELQEQFEEALEEQLEEINESLVNNIDEYLSLVVEEWLEKNEVAIEKSLRAELSENFIQQLGQLFVEHNFNIPEEQVEVADMLADKVDSLEEDLNSVYLENIQLKEFISELKKNEIVNTLSEGLTEIEKDKFTTLTEGFEIEEDLESFVNKLETIKNHHFNKSTPLKNKTQLITEEIEYTEEEVAEENKPQIPDGMKAYVEAFKRIQ